MDERWIVPDNDMGKTMRRVDAHDRAKRPVRVPAGGGDQVLQHGRKVAATVDLACDVAKRKYPRSLIQAAAFSALSRCIMRASPWQIYCLSEERHSPCSSG